MARTISIDNKQKAGAWHNWFEPRDLVDSFESGLIVIA